MGFKSILARCCPVVYFLALWLKQSSALFFRGKLSLSDIFRCYPILFSDRSSNKSIYVRKAQAFKKLLEKMKVQIKSTDLLLGRRTIYTFPFYARWQEVALLPVSNLTPNYQIVLSKGLTGLREELIKKDHNDFVEAALIAIDAAIDFARRYKISFGPAASFQQALQNVFFVNLLLWIEGHLLIGLGRMDYYLWPYYEADLKAGKLTKELAYELIKNFFIRLNEDFDRKSSILFGDTGQTIVLAGKNNQDKDTANDLTLMFLAAASELCLIDPKIILRVNQATSNLVWEKSIELLGRGTGSPLYINDEIVIPALSRQGYREEDRYHYGVSACWEPLIPGKSFDQNNVGCVNFVEVLEAAINNGKCLLNNKQVGLMLGYIEDFISWPAFLLNVKQQIAEAIRLIVKNSSNNKFGPSPFLSLLMADCFAQDKDISQGGARYNNFGILNAGFVNMINALIAIKKLAFDSSIVEKKSIGPILVSNFKNREELRKQIETCPKFGNDITEVDDLAAGLAEFFGQEAAKHQNQFGGHYRAGLGSADSYISKVKKLAASFDGRKHQEPFASSFSASPGTGKVGPTALINSVTKTDLKQVSNGSVLDLKISPTVFNDRNYPKLKKLLQVFVKKGGEAIQFNVVNVETLLQAQKKPEQYRDLIVRVWGFSAYFVDLPREYQDHIIKREEYRG